MSISASIISSVDELDSVAEQWRELLGNSDSDTLFLTPEWISTWLETCGTDASLFVIAVYRNDLLIGIAPFYIAKLRFFRLISLDCLRILADQNSSAEYQDLVVHRNFAAEALEQFAEVLADNAHRFMFVWIPYSDVERGASSRFEDVFSRLGLLVRARAFEYYVVSLPREKSAFDALLSSKQRNNIRRYKKRLEQRGRLGVADLAHSTTADEVFDILASLHARRWQAQGESGAFERKPLFADFTRSFARTARQHGWLAAFCLSCDNEPIAMRFGYVYKGIFYEIQAGFAPELGGSGIVVIDGAIEMAIALGIEEYDFLGYGGEYKSRFNARAKPGKGLFAARRNPFTRLLFRLNIWPTGRHIQQI